MSTRPQMTLLRIALIVSGALFAMQLLRREPVLGLVLALLVALGLWLATRRRGARPAAPEVARRRGAGWQSAALGLAGALACGLVAVAVLWTRLPRISDGTDLSMRAVQMVFVFMPFVVVTFPTTWGLAVMGLWLREALLVEPQKRRVTKGMKVAASFALLVHLVSLLAWRLFAPQWEPEREPQRFARPQETTQVAPLDLRHLFEGPAERDPQALVTFTLAGQRAVAAVRSPATRDLGLPIADLQLAFSDIDASAAPDAYGCTKSFSIDGRPATIVRMHYRPVVIERNGPEPWSPAVGDWEEVVVDPFPVTHASRDERVRFRQVRGGYLCLDLRSNKTTVVGLARTPMSARPIAAAPAPSSPDGPPELAAIRGHEIVRHSAKDVTLASRHCQGEEDTPEPIARLELRPEPWPGTPDVDEYGCTRTVLVRGQTAFLERSAFFANVLGGVSVADVATADVRTHPTGTLGYAGISADGRRIFLASGQAPYACLDAASGEIVGFARKRHRLYEPRWRAFVTHAQGSERWGLTERNELFRFSEVPGPTPTARTGYRVALTPQSGPGREVDCPAASDPHGIQGSPDAIEIKDGKLFVTGFGHDNYLRLGVFDLDSGKRLLDDFGGAFVPVGPHEMYYCAPCCYEQHEPLFALIDTRSLARRLVDRLPCPGKVGRLLPHPHPGRFVFAWNALC